MVSFGVNSFKSRKFHFHGAIFNAIVGYPVRGLCLNTS